LPRRCAFASIAALILTGVACTASTDWALDGTGFPPPAKYRVLWRTTELCSGMTGDFDAVTWFVTQGSADGDEPNITGSWYPEGNRIFLHQTVLDDDKVVRHEMLHALLRAGHEPAFVGSCGGLVTCAASCVTEAGGIPLGPGSESPVIAPEELLVSVDVIEPTLADTGWMAVIITATNPRAAAVWVDLSGRPDVQFECRLDNGLCGPRDSFRGLKGPFGAAETRREAMTFRVQTGSHAIWGAYNTVVRGPVSVMAP